MKGVSQFTPNYKTHQAFGDTLVKVSQAGVNVLAFDCVVKPDKMIVDKPIPVKY
jgi:sugar fermentation stimulation protein A